MNLMDDSTGIASDGGGGAAAAAVMEPGMIRRLARRERQVAETVGRFGEASAEEVRAALPDPLSNAAIRSMLRRLEEKGVLTRRKAGRKFLYRLTRPSGLTRDAAVRRLSQDYFDGSLAKTAAAVVGLLAGEDERKR
jgi:predicted transcriptional regulator